MASGDRAPVPDPTVLTTEALERGLGSERELTQAKLDAVLARLDAMDRATEVLHQTVTRQPTVVATEVGHVREMMAQQQEATDQRFIAAQGSLQLAFDAQKELGQAVAKANAEAIGKAERATAEALAGLRSMIESGLRELAEKHADLKERVSKIENVKVGGQQTVGSILTVISAVVAVVSLAVAILIATR